MVNTTSIPKSTPHNLGLFRLQGFSGRHSELLQLHDWLTGPAAVPAIFITGPQGIGKSTLATAVAWNHLRHFSDGIIRVGAAGGDRFRIYDIVRTMDTVFGTTLTRVSEERWGINILEQLYRRKRLLILDELSGATERELSIIVNIISHLHESGGQSRILLINRNYSPVIADLVQAQLLPLRGLERDTLAQFVQTRAPEQVRAYALEHLDELYEFTAGEPLTMRLALGLLLDYSWPELAIMLQDMSIDDASALAPLAQADAEPAAAPTARWDSINLVGFAVENLAVAYPEVGPLLDRLVSAAGGASMAALHELFGVDLGPSLDEALQQLQDRALLERDRFQGRVVMHPVVRRYLSENATMLGEEWDRSHGVYYANVVQDYQMLPLERWPEVDVEWGNIYEAAHWCAGRVQRLWERAPLEIISDPAIDETGLPLEQTDMFADLRLTRTYALALAHYAFWRHPPSIVEWLAAGAVAALALSDMRNYAWLLMSIGRYLFFKNEVEEAVPWLDRARTIFDERDLLRDLIYVYTDLGTSLRILNKPRQALDYFLTVFDCIAELGDPTSLSTAYMNLGSAYYSVNNFEQALRKHRRALRVAMRRNDRYAIASAYNNMGLALERMERLPEAEQAYERALHEFRRIGDLIGVSTCYNNLGSVNYERGEYGQALKWYELDLKLSEVRGTWTDMAAT
ncbi:MAG: tetratricopeptide repeat protein, partial [Caldilineaceae bacterium]|nr:tetratricopeptide repeat protein [Caldilineaceae bacterium]